MKIVKFKDGQFGIRRGNILFGYYYLCMKEGNFWFSLPHNVKERGHGSYSTAIKYLKLKKVNSKLDKGEIVKNKAGDK